MDFRIDVRSAVRAFVDQRRTAGQLRKLAHERARTMPHNRLGMSLPAALRDIDPVPQDEESARRNLAGRDHALPGHIGFALTEPFQPLNLFRLEHRKDLLSRPTQSPPLCERIATLPASPAGLRSSCR